MKRLRARISRWRTARSPGDAAEVVVTETAPATSHRRRNLAIGAAILAITAATAFGLLYRGEPATPEPAVPAGQLAREMEEQRMSAAASPVTIDREMAERMGLQTAVVEERSLDRPIQITGRVAVDERRISRVHSKVDGWIEQTFANFEGQQVRKGQPLFTIYSPDLVATQQELLIALSARRSFEKSEFAVVRASGDSLVEVARRRLRLWNMTPQQIADVERTGKTIRAVTVYAPASGAVVERKALPGVRVTPDTELYTLADLARVWVEADLFESDMAGVRIGTTAEITLPSGEVRGGRVTFINPFLTPESRTAKVRIELPNPGMTLMPGMFVSVRLSAKGVPRPVVPRDAVLDTGARKLVLVDEGEGRFGLREIRTGEQGPDFYTVVAGLSAGERVARNIQFLVDSETPLRQAVEQFPRSAPAASGESAPASMPGMPGMPGMPAESKP